MSPVLAFEVILRDDAGPDDALHVIVPVLRALDERIVGTVTVTDVDRQRAELDRLRRLLAEVLGCFDPVPDDAAGATGWIDSTTYARVRREGGLQ